MSMGFHRFSSEESVEIKHRGTLHLFGKSQIPKDMWDPVRLMGQIVLIDGVEHYVRGVETFAIPRSWDHPYRLGFGLLI